MIKHTESSKKPEFELSKDELDAAEHKCSAALSKCVIIYYLNI